MREVLRSRGLIAAILAYAASITASNIIPLQVIAFSTIQKLNDEQSGIAAMCEASLLAITTVIATALPPRAGRVAGVLGPIAVVGAQLGSIWVPDLPRLCVLRGIVGAGCGLASASVSRAIAASSAAGSAFSLANGVSAVMIGSLLALIPWFPSSSPGVRVFVSLALLALGLALTSYKATQDLPIAPAPAAPIASRIGTHPLVPAGGLIIATLLIYVPLGGIWTFSEQLGIGVGLTDRDVGGLLIFAVFAGLIGGALAAGLEKLVGGECLVVIAGVSALASCLCVAMIRGATSFGAAFAFYSASYQFAISAFQVVASSVDRTGRLPAILLGTTLIGYALGSYIVGYLFHVGRPQLIWTGGAWACGFAILPSLVALRWAKPRDAPVFKT